MSYRLILGQRKITYETPCPYCEKYSTYTVVRAVPDKWREWEGGRYLLIGYVILRCDNCSSLRICAEMLIFGRQYLYFGGRPSDISELYANDPLKVIPYAESRKTLMEYPFPSFYEIKRNKIPQDVIKDLDEGYRCLQAGAPKGAIVCFRRALESVCVLLGASGSTLAERIEDLYKKEVIRKATKEYLHQLRSLGNLGAHPYELKKLDKEPGIKDDFGCLTLEDAKILADFLRLFLEDVYVFPQKAEKLAKRIAELEGKEETRIKADKRDLEERKENA